MVLALTSHGSPASGKDQGTSRPSVVIWKADGAVMIKMAGQTYQLGSAKNSAETPRHEKHLDEYYIDRTEVTWRMYLEFCKETKRDKPVKYRYTDPFPERMLDHPVVDVTWDDAKSYCKWTGKRLPSENEWEGACAGPNGQPYTWGGRFSFTACNTSKNTLGETAPVGSMPECKSPAGAMDMSGNVNEWTADWYKSYNGADMKFSYVGKERVAKGGSIVHSISFLRCQARDAILPDEYSSYCGFRCAVTPDKKFAEKTVPK